MSKVKFLIGDATDLDELQNADGQFIIAVDDSQLNAYVDYDDNGTIVRKQVGGKVTGVKGNSEATYRTGDVNITASNVGLGNVGNFKAVSTEASQGLTDTEKSNARTNIGAGTSNFSGSYNDLTDKPETPAAQVNADWNAASGVAEILNKPTLGTAAGLNVAATGDASSSQVVKGNDTRLTDPRTPTSHTHTKSEITDFPTLGTAASKNSTNAVTSGSTALVESGAVKTAIDNAVASAYHPAGTKEVSELTSALLVAANEGCVYNITNSGTTTADFIEGSGKPISAGDNVGVAKVGNEFKFDLLSGFVDTSNFIKKSSTAGLVKNDGTVDTTTYQTKLSAKGSATQGVYVDSNGALQTMTNTLGKSVPSDAVFTDTDTKNTAGSTDSSSKLFLIGATSQAANPQTYSHDTAYVGTDGCLYSGSAKVLTAHQDISGKADKVSSATSGNFAGLDANGNLTDSGKKPSDFLTSHQTIKQDGVTGATVNRFGTCSTAAATAAKTVSITTGTFNLEAGAKVSVKFSNANTADSPTLNVNSKGAKNIFHKGSQITTGGNKALLAGVVDFIYDGTQWHLIGNYIDTNTTYSSKAAASGGTDVSLVTTGEKYTWNNKANSGDIPSAYTSNPAMNGTASAGSSTAWARGDHVHPTDTTKVDVLQTANIAYGTCSTAADTAQKSVTLSTKTGWKLEVGAIIVVKFTNTNTANDPTLKVGSTDAKSIWYNTDVITTSNLNKAGYENRYEKYMYDGTNYVWIGHSIDDNTTYTPPKLGIGYGTCSTSSGTAYVASMSNYTLVTGGIVTIKFSNAVPASATLNINSKGAKSIYHKGSAIAANVIKAGDYATFIYSTQYHLIAIDRTATADNDTKNTAGSTDSSSKLFLIGATSQAANPQTYSHDTAYVGTDGCLYSGSKKVLTDIATAAQIRTAINGVR